ncbi:NB-ARC domain-containing protein [Actinokineospora enzanensis]|uniref:NB-ARC domain-containing protein n=1 Tax=Actinokineospora enzanensis TaxID=155975 RepID=UPI0003A0EC67|nr:NB-ARC domain-containing protein [Actinokineospora enzanensis]
MTAGDGVNRIAGDVGRAVQAGEIHGDVHLHAGAAAERARCRFGQVPPRVAGFQPRPVAGGGLVLVGMGGAGKTQIAADLAHAAREAGTEVVAWVNAASRDRVITAYTELAHRISGVERAPDDAVSWLLGWLDTAPSWLVVLDDAGSPDEVRGLVPAATPTGRVVVTTRHRGVAWRTFDRQVVEVGLFSAEQARECLTAWLAREPHLLDGADELVAELGRLPLAVGQAGAYLADRGISCVDYRRRFRERRLSDLFPDADELPEGLDRVVALTWAISLTRADEREPVGVARPLMHVLSVLDPNGIPTGLLAARRVRDYLSTGRDTPVTEEQVWDAARSLARLNLIAMDTRPEASAVGIRVHALVQRATREHASPERVTVQTRVAADALMSIWPSVQNDPTLGDSLRANAAALPDGPLWTMGVHPVLVRVGQSLGVSGQVRVAHRYFTELHLRAVEAFGTDHPDTLSVRHEVAFWQGRAGDAAGAMAAYETLLADRVRVLSEDDPAIVNTRACIAHYRGESGDPAGALVEFRSLLPDQIRLLGADHPQTLLTRSNIAYWRGWSGDPAGALADFRLLLPDQLHLLGADHPDTLLTRNNVAYWRGRSGDPEGALADLLALLPDRARVMGVDNPNTFVTRAAIAAFRGETGDVVGALADLQALLADQHRVLGVDHPAALATRADIGRWSVVVES